MKLVAAKCPNCGASIEVDKKTESTKCEYCKSKIIVDDAIAKYKLEIEVKNMPKLENYLELGRRYYDEYDFEEAYNLYSKALELNPNNPEAILYKGISKALCTTYRDFELYTAFKATKSALKLLNESEKELNDKYVLELVNATLNLQQFAIDFYEKHDLDLIGVERFIDKLKLCLEVLEYSYKKIYYDKNKIFIINFIIKLIKYLLKNKKFINDDYKKEIYIQDLKYKMELLNKRKDYKEKLYILNPGLKQKEEVENKRKMNILLLMTLEVFILSFIVNAFKQVPYSIWGILLIVDFVLILPVVSKKVFKNKRKEISIKLILLVIGVLGVIMSDTPEFSKYTYRSNTTNLVIEFNRNEVTINGKKQTYEHEEKSNYTIIKIGNNTFKYRRVHDEYLFCQLDNNECKHYFSSNNNKHKYLNK